MASKYIEIRVRVDNDDTLANLKLAVGRRTTSRNSTSGHAIIDLSAGDHVIDMDYCVSSRRRCAYIRNARLTIWRVE